MRQAEVMPGVPPPVFFALQRVRRHRAQAAGHRPPPARACDSATAGRAHDETTAVLAEAERLSTALVPEDSVTVSQVAGRASLPLGGSSAPA